MSLGAALLRQNARCDGGAAQVPAADAVPRSDPHGMPAQPEAQSAVEVDVSKPILAQVCNLLHVYNNAQPTCPPPSTAGMHYLPPLCNAVWHDVLPHSVVGGRISMSTWFAGWTPGPPLQGVGALAGARRPALLCLTDARGAQLHRLVGCAHCALFEMSTSFYRSNRGHSNLYWSYD